MATNYSVNKIQPTTVLTALGFIPFVVFFLAVIFTEQPTEMATVFTSYSAIILSFLSGSLWGSKLRENIHTDSLVVLLISNLLSVFAWTSLLINSLIAALTLLAMSFTTIYFSEKLSLPHLKRYLAMRRLATICVVILHLSVILALTL